MIRRPLPYWLWLFETMPGSDDGPGAATVGGHAGPVQWDNSIAVAWDNARPAAWRG